MDSPSSWLQRNTVPSEVPSGPVQVTGLRRSPVIEGITHFQTGRFVQRLTSSGDNSYPGLVWHDGILWVSYYSSHRGAQTRIHLAKVRLKSP